jgi:GMP synthase (glutamine-hydrolysing)
MLPVAVVQHEPSVPPGSIAEVLTGSGVDHFVIEAWQAPTWPAADELGALVVMGGTMNVDDLDGYPFLRSSRRLMADALERGVPTLGVCLGSQMMARVLGGDVFRSETRNALFSELDVDAAGAADPLIEPFATGAPVLQFHEDTFTVPDGATPLATSAATGLAQAFRYGANAYAIQFHFEVDAAILRAWCRTIGERAMVGDWGISEEDLMIQADKFVADQYQAGKELFTRFLRT